MFFILLVFVDGGKQEKTILNKSHLWRRAGIESNGGHNGGRPSALTTALSLLPKTHRLFWSYLFIFLTLRRFTYEGLNFQTYSLILSRKNIFQVAVHVNKFSTKLYFLVTITGVDNADLMCVAPKGSKNIWVFEEAADKNNIGEKSILYVVLKIRWPSHTMCSLSFNLIKEQTKQTLSQCL